MKRISGFLLALPKVLTIMNCLDSLNGHLESCETYWASPRYQNDQGEAWADRRS
ncbi:MAG TPA: hypothetical protein VLT16_17260 [Candidatus Limnocylindrales bacterium]|nr:hypothetical protein [Candidatus Limnocylindrales bacterium]